MANAEDPCLIFPDQRGDWRWRSWRWLAAEAGAWAATLGDLPSGALVGYRWRPAPDAVAADLGIQAAGGVAVPVVEGHEAALPPLDRWLAVSAEGPPEGVEAPAVARAGATAAEQESRSAAWRAGVLVPEPASPLPGPERAAAGGALVRGHDGWKRWGQRELAIAATPLRVPANGSGGAVVRRPARPIALVAGDLAAAPERAWLAWTLAAGAALVLPGDPAFAAWAIFWPRPTDVLLPADHLGMVREVLATFGKARAVRRRLERLRRLLVWGGEPSADEALAWHGLGVGLRPFPR